MSKQALREERDDGADVDETVVRFDVAEPVGSQQETNQKLKGEPYVTGEVGGGEKDGCFRVFVLQFLLNKNKNKKILFCKMNPPPHLQSIRKKI